jgi:hypothetical protein
LQCLVVSLAVPDGSQEVTAAFWFISECTVCTLIVAMKIKYEKLKSENYYVRYLLSVSYWKLPTICAGPRHEGCCSQKEYVMQHMLYTTNVDI